MSVPNLEGKLLCEGKTKKIIGSGERGIVHIRSKPVLTAGDGEKKLELPRKDLWSTDMVANIYPFLEEHGIRTHYISRLDSITFRARHLAMCPFEVVARGTAYGSYVRRNPQCQSGSQLSRIVTEIFLKDDSLHDPFVHVDRDSGMVHLYSAKAPIESQKPIASKGMKDYVVKEAPVYSLYRYPMEYLDDLYFRTKVVFLLLERAWSRFGMLLVDIKLEFGVDVTNGELYLGCVISNDEHRLWLDGDPEKMLDKEVFRKSRVVDDELIERLTRNYERVALTTFQFNR